jgi:hypothetical protein
LGRAGKLELGEAGETWFWRGDLEGEGADLSYLAGERGGGGAEREIQPASLGGDGIPQRGVQRRHGIGQRDNPVA